MIFVARYRGATSVVVEAPTVEDASAKLVAELPHDVPAMLFPLPEGVAFVAEVRLPTMDEGAEGEDENPANVSDAACVLEPFDELANFLEAVEHVELPEAVPPTEPAPPGGG